MQIIWILFIRIPPIKYFNTAAQRRQATICDPQHLRLSPENKRKTKIVFPYSIYFTIPDMFSSTDVRFSFANNLCFSLATFQHIVILSLYIITL